MKKFTILLFIAASTIGFSQAKVHDLLPSTNRYSVFDDTFLKFLGERIKYPENARTKNIQGSSILLFTVEEGKLKDLHIHAEIGGGCDIEVVNAVLAYPNFRQQQDGKYALKANFRLNEGINTADNDNIPEGYQLLQLTIVGAPLVATNNYSKEAHVKGVSIFEVNNGTRTDLTLRGFAGQINRPKIIVDGIELDEFGHLNPESIESISILKGTSAIQQFGTSAINGAIIITTKQKVKPIPLSEELIKGKKN